MDLHLNEALTDAVRRWARPTTPDELKRRGVSRVRTVSMRRVASLIEKAVNRTMLARTLGEYPEDAESFSEAAREEFLRLMGDNSPTRDAEADGAVAAKAADTLGQLRRELAQRRRTMEEQRRSLDHGEGATGAGDKELEQRLRELFVAWGGSPARPSPLEREVIELAVAHLRRERGTSERLRLDDHEREIGLLERRITKLTKLLGETEAELQRAVQMASGDPGLASIYDSVQGLAGEDAQFAKKAQLMKAIYDANLELRDEMAHATGS